MELLVISIIVVGPIGESMLLSIKKSKIYFCLLCDDLHGL